MCVCVCWLYAQQSKLHVGDQYRSTISQSVRQHSNKGRKTRTRASMSRTRTAPTPTPTAAATATIRDYNDRHCNQKALPFLVFGGANSPQLSLSPWSCASDIFELFLGPASAANSLRPWISKPGFHPKNLYGTVCSMENLNRNPAAGLQPPTVPPWILGSSAGALRGSSAHPTNPCGWASLAGTANNHRPLPGENVT